METAMVVKALALVVAAVCGAAALGEGVRMAPGLESGRVHRYEVGYTLERGLSLGAGRDRLVQEAGLRLEVTGVDEGGVATVAGRVEWVVIDLDRASFRVRVDTRDIAGDSPNKAETQIRELVQAYLDSSFTVRVSGAGLVEELTGFEPVTAMLASGQGSLLNLSTGRLLPGPLAQDLEPIWNADGGAGRTVSVGDSWKSERLSPIGAGVSMKMETDFVVTSVEGGVVRFGGGVEASIVLPDFEGEMPVRFSVEEQSGSASGVWDVSAGVLRERAAETSHTLVVTAGESKQGSQRMGRSWLRLVEDAGE